MAVTKRTRFIGPWKHVEMWLTGAAQGSLGKVAQERIKQVGTELVYRVRRQIAGQKLPWEPLSQYTISRKGFSTIYLEKGEFRSSIGIEVTLASKFKTKIRVGPSTGSNRKGVPFQELASMLEYGTSMMPARPLWRPTYLSLRRSPKWKKLAAEVVENW